MDCVQLYEEAHHRLHQLVKSGGRTTRDVDDARAWLSGALTNHRTCVDGLNESGTNASPLLAVEPNVTASLRHALASYAALAKDNVITAWTNDMTVASSSNSSELDGGGLLASWDPTQTKADVVVAQDGSGDHKTITEALSALAKRGRDRPNRVVVHVKAGVYAENVEIDVYTKNVMFVGDGIDRTIVTSNRNVLDGSATFGVSGDGFWARDVTFENTAGPRKHQAVALRVGSDRSVFYRCSFRGYQDTLLSCDIYVRRPMEHQANMVTAQARDDPNQETGISVHASRVRAAPDLLGLEGRFRSYLGRPWKRYARTVFMKTEMEGLVDPKGWTEWSGDFAVRTLFYGEYMNSGGGARTEKRVGWPGFHVLRDAEEAWPFTV
ncbi:putative pectinesterase/pectinesterase inhibitor 36 [Acorus calamus]|uniref:Pectinesterase/pectinesterase inhibitor 36 n=1 Tax=Acorus calamus TaxID=4465 RepID=A0AAV9DZ03_ACOCL|nr:putative pectinesterase/pectinesterase inhibitor 36 [Acorus calamus]